MATFVDTVSIRLTLDDTEVRAAMAKVNADFDALRSRLNQGGLSSAADGFAGGLVGGSLIPKTGAGPAVAAGIAFERGQALTRAARARAASIATGAQLAMAASDGMALANAVHRARVAVGASSYGTLHGGRSYEGSGTGGDWYAGKGIPDRFGQYTTPSGFMSGAEIARIRAGLPPAVWTLTPGGVPTANMPGATISHGGGIYSTPAYTPRVPSVPLKLAPSTSVATGSGIAGTGISGSAAKRLFKTLGAPVGVVGAMAFARGVSAQRNKYWHEMLSTPGSTPEFKPFSSMAVSAFEKGAEFGTRIMTAIVYDVPAAVLSGALEGLARIGAISGTTAAKWEGGLAMVGAEVEASLGLDQAALQQTLERQNQEAEAFNRLRRAAHESAKRVGLEALEKAKKLGIDGVSGVEFANIFAMDKKLRNEILKRSHEQQERAKQERNSVVTVSPEDVLKGND